MADNSLLIQFQFFVPKLSLLSEFVIIQNISIYLYNNYNKIFLKSQGGLYFNGLKTLQTEKDNKKLGEQYYSPNDIIF